MMTERELLERFVSENDQGAFRTLVERHGPMVIGVCRSVLSDAQDVDDAFQATFLILVQRAATIRQRECIGPWLHRVALRVANQSRVKSYNRRARERQVARPEGKTDQTQYELVPRALLHEELNRLPDRYRLPLVLCYFEGKTNEEAASYLHCPVGTIKGRLWRARGRLREQLFRRGIVPFA